MGGTARRAAIATLVVGGIVVLALALWKIKIVIALVFLGFIIAAAMRPGVEWLQRRARLPRGVGVLVHYLALAGVVALVLWVFVPRAIDQVQQATSTSTIHQQATHSTGIKHDILAGLDKRLSRLPSGAQDRASRARGDEDRVRGARRDLLHVRGRRVLDLRARPDDRPRAVDGADEAPARHARHLGADRPEARRLRARPAAC